MVRTVGLALPVEVGLDGVAVAGEEVPVDGVDAAFSPSALLQPATAQVSTAARVIDTARRRVVPGICAV
jgi:hypothetical protein